MTRDHRLAGVRVYARLATQAGVLLVEEWVRMQGVHGYAGWEARRLDTARTAAISPAQAQQLTHLPAESAGGRRDNLLMALLLSLGLRVGEVVLLRRIEKDGKAGRRALSTRGAAQRVLELGRAAGIEALSPHDCRHYWASLAARSDTDPFALQEAGGWASLEMPRRYIERQRVANEHVRLDGRKREYRAGAEVPAGKLEEIKE